MNYKVGDSVKIKQGVKDAEYGKWDLSGWQGWIVKEPTPDDPVFELIWDTKTLKNMPNEFIIEGNVDEVDWVHYVTKIDEIETATPRDTFDAAIVFAEFWDDKHAFNDGSEEGAIIMKVVGEEKEMFKALEKWQRYLTENLKFPFEVTVVDSDNKAVKEGLTTTVTGFSAKAIDEDDGLMVKVKVRDVGVPHPLCDLTPSDEDDANWIYMEAYTGWFICQ